MSAFRIRNYHSSDLYNLYRICLKTGADGEDATGTVDDEILGHFFAAPYAVLDPSLCFILTVDGAPGGYLVGTADSAAFARRTEAEWFPPLRTRYPLPAPTDRSRQAEMIRAVHAGYRPPPLASTYPAHLHIDILPVGQGAGQGRQLIETFLSRLRAQGVPGVHLGVSRRNERALAFYPRCGFKVIDESKGSVTFGMKLL